MTPKEQWDAVDRYFGELFSPADPALDSALRDSEAAGLPPIQVSAAQGKLLMLLARAIGARNILEIGTLAAYSTIWLARGLMPAAGGRVVTLEAVEKHAKVARANLARAGVDSLVEVRLGQAVDSLTKLAAEKRDPFDFIFIDADKPSYPQYLEWSLRLSRRGTIIIADNVVRKGAIIDAASSDPDVQGMRRFNELLASERRVSATAIQTVGSKGYDGFALAVVTG
jgi:predicted O-methyltransferase YrrM